MKILDVCCGSRMFWYDKQEPHTTYMDIRKAVYTAIDRGNGPGVSGPRWRAYRTEREKEMRHWR